MERGTLIALGLTAGTLAFLYSQREATASNEGDAKPPPTGGYPEPGGAVLIPNEVTTVLASPNATPAAVQEMITRLQRDYPGRFLDQLGELQAKLINLRVLSSLGLVQAAPLPAGLQTDVNALLSIKNPSPAQIDALITRVRRDYPDRISDPQIINLQAKAIYLRGLYALGLEEGVSEVPACPPGKRWVALGSPDEMRIPHEPGDPWVYSMQQPPSRYNETTGESYLPPRIAVKGRCVPVGA